MKLSKGMRVRFEETAMTKRAGKMQVNDYTTTPPVTKDELCRHGSTFLDKEEYNRHGAKVIGEALQQPYWMVEYLGAEGEYVRLAFHEKHLIPLSLTIKDILEKGE